MTSRREPLHHISLCSVSWCYIIGSLQPVPLEFLLHLLVQCLGMGLSYGLLGRSQVLLRTLRFDLIAEQPLRYLLNFCRLLHCSHAVSKLAVCLACPLINSPLAYTICDTAFVSLLACQQQLALLAKLMVATIELNQMQHTCLCMRCGMGVAKVALFETLLGVICEEAMRR